MLRSRPTALWNLEKCINTKLNRRDWFQMYTHCHFYPLAVFRAPHNPIFKTWERGGAVCGSQSELIHTYAHIHIPFLLTLKWRLQLDLNRTCKQLDLNTDSTGWILNPWGHKDHTRTLRRSHSGVHCKGEKKDKNMHHTMFVERSHCYGSIFMQTYITQTLFWCLTNCISLSFFVLNGEIQKCFFFPKRWPRFFP